MVGEWDSADGMFGESHMAAALVLPKRGPGRSSGEVSPGFGVVYLIVFGSFHVQAQGVASSWFQGESQQLKRYSGRS